MKRPVYSSYRMNMRRALAQTV